MKKRFISLFIMLIISSIFTFLIIFNINLYCQDDDCMTEWEDECINHKGKYYYSSPNGCTVVADYFHTEINGEKYTWIWTGVCNIHDLCYMTFNSGKENCDAQFLNNLLNSYSNNFDDNGNKVEIKCEDNPECKKMAKAYASGVDSLIGNLIYNHSQKSQKEFLECINISEEINCANW